MIWKANLEAAVAGNVLPAPFAHANPLSPRRLDRTSRTGAQVELASLSKPGVSAAVRILQISKQLRQHPSLGYAVAFLAIGFATLLQWVAQDQFAGAPFLTIYPAVILTTLIGGLGAGFLAAVLAGASQWGLFIPILHWVAALSYAFDATLCVMLIAFINRTFDVLLVNIDHEKQAKQHQYLLAKELHHRIQNLFTVIQAIIRFSLPGDEMIQESDIKQRLTDRLQSMAATNQAITDAMGDGVCLIDLINSEIHGFESQFEISGTAGLVLGPQMTQNFSLILHELLINALKYGALSVPQGRVSLRLDWTSWVLTFVWQERHGPPVLPPARAGFGSRILGAFAKSFCQNVDASYAPDGLRYTLQIHADPNRFMDFAPVATAAPDSALADMSISEPGATRSWFDQIAEFKHQMEMVLHDWELYQAGKDEVTK
jgi:two-component sensor histidine kinase